MGSLFQSGIAQIAQTAHDSWAICSKVAWHKLHKWLMGSLFQSGMVQTAQIAHGSWAVCSKVAFHKWNKLHMTHGQFVPKWHCTNGTNCTWLMGSLFQSGMAQMEQMAHGSWAVCSKVAWHKLHKLHMAQGKFGVIFLLLIQAFFTVFTTG